MKYYIDLGKITNRYDITIAELAHKTGIHASNLSRIKRNKTVSLNNLSKIAEALNIQDVNELLSIQQN
ncbi:helix-turn-helix domain-containing protein [Bacillus pacificus]